MLPNLQNRSGSLYVYILRCADGSYYVGITNDINKMLKEHNEGVNKGAYTYNKRPVGLVYWQNLSDHNQAIE
ncbi:MAG: GIY-YIG nuclease family protein [Bacteroidota bacterium]